MSEGELAQLLLDWMTANTDCDPVSSIEQICLNRTYFYPRDLARWLIEMGVK